MQILVNSDHHIRGSEALTGEVESAVESAVGHFGDRITRVEVHLSDVNSHKQGDRDKRCLMEARLGGLRPVAVSHQAPTLPEAINAAAAKLERAISSMTGRLGETKGPAPTQDQVAPVEELERLLEASKEPDQ